MRQPVGKFVVIVGLTLLVIKSLLLSSAGGAPAAEPGPWPTHPSPQKRRPAREPAAPTPQADYSKFSHLVRQHQRACDACHKFPTSNWKEVRKDKDAFPDITDYPQHASCLSCHRQQFFSGARPVICTNCHTNPSPRDSSRHPFPNPGEIFDQSPKGQTELPEFTVDFPHEKHKELFENCSVCHQVYQPQGESKEEFVTPPPKGQPEGTFWLKKGTFMTVPRSHAACFTCHTEEGLKPGSTDCATCHKLRPPGEGRWPIPARNDFDPKLAAQMGVKDKWDLWKWSWRDTVKFQHEHPVHSTAGCTDCHNIAQLKLTVEKTLKVPISACAACHGDAEGFIASELGQKRARPSFECTKCHVKNGQRQPPESHVNVAKQGSGKE